MNNESESPLDDFSGCHEGIIRNFRRLQDLVDMIEESSDSASIRETAKTLVNFFDQVVFTHHAEEEQELFVAVMDHADDEKQKFETRGHIKRLVAEHRELEALWKRIETDIWRLSQGKNAELDGKLARQLANQYLGHAEFEEQIFLPLAARILSKSGMARLGKALHRRHQEMTRPYFV